MAINIAIQTYRFVGVFFIPSIIINSLSLPSKSQTNKNSIHVGALKCKVKVENKLNDKLFPFEAPTQIAVPSSSLSSV